MLVSFVLRVRPDEVAQQRFVGEIEAVATGRNQVVRSLADIVAFCELTCTGEPSGTPHHSTPTEGRKS